MTFISYIRDKTRFLYLKMIREKASPEYIARGWAIGMFFGLAAPLGVQLIVSIPFAFLFKGSKIGAALGTVPITNPITVFAIYPVQCLVGNFILRGNLTRCAVEEALKSVLSEKSFQALQVLSWDILFAFLVGGVLFGILVAVPTYYGVLALVKRHRSRKRRQKR